MVHRGVVYGERVKPLVIDYISDHISEHIDNTMFAAVAGTSLKYFNAVFKKTLGLTPGQYINQVKMKMAVKYIKEGGHTYKQIAYMLGFADQYTLLWDPRPSPERR